MWNLVFNRGFGPSFLVRLVKAVLYELYLIPFDDSCFLDSPLSDLGFEQCHSLQAFLRNPCLDPAAQADFDVLTAGEGRSVIVSSQLRRAAATAAIGLADRLKRTNEPILMHSSCQEISRNFDTLSITEAGKGPVLRGSVELERKLHYDGTANKGSKSLGFRGMHRIEDFAAWAAKRNESTLTARTNHLTPARHRPDARAPAPRAGSPPPTPTRCVSPALAGTIIVAGHSLWFKEFFKLYLPKAADHTCKKKKIVNCGAVGFTLQTASPRGVTLGTPPGLGSRPRAACPPSCPPSRPPSRWAWPSSRPRMHLISSLAATESAWPISRMLFATQAVLPTAACATGSTPPRSASSTAGSLPSEHPALLRRTRHGKRVARSAGSLQKCQARTNRARRLGFILVQGTCGSVL